MLLATVISVAYPKPFSPLPSLHFLAPFLSERWHTPTLIMFDQNCYIYNNVVDFLCIYLANWLVPKDMSHGIIQIDTNAQGKWKRESYVALFGSVADETLKRCAAGGISSSAPHDGAAAPLISGFACYTSKREAHLKWLANMVPDPILRYFRNTNI